MSFRTLDQWDKILGSDEGEEIDPFMDVLKNVNSARAVVESTAPDEMDRIKVVYSSESDGEKST